MTSEVYAFTCWRGGSERRLNILEATIKSGREKAGMDFHWEVFDNAMHNRGQHVVFNEALKKAKAMGCTHLLRVDDDIEFLSHRWLVKMVEASEALGAAFILSPTVKGLKHPPEMSQMIDVQGVPVKFLTEAIGGACRLHPMKLLTESVIPYVSDVRLPLGFGDATGVMKWAKKLTALGQPIYCVWLDHVRVQHSTAKQEAEDPQYHATHDILQHMPYIPPWPREYKDD